MSKTIEPSYLAEALQQELENYTEEVTQRVNEVGSVSIKKLQKLTKATAPKDRPEYCKHIATQELKKGAFGMKSYLWYVKAPSHRLTHLLVRGHETRDGGRTKADPFLHNALDTVLPEYERNVEEAIKK